MIRSSSRRSATSTSNTSPSSDNPRAYLHLVAKVIAQGWPQAKLRELLPDRVLAAHPELYVGYYDAIKQPVEKAFVLLLPAKLGGPSADTGCAVDCGMRVVAVGVAILLRAAACNSGSGQPSAADGCGSPAGPDCTKYPNVTCPVEECGVQYGCVHGVEFS